MPVPNQQQTPRTIYDDIADEQVRQANQQAAQSVAVHTGESADAAGAAQRLGAATGAGPVPAAQDPVQLQKTLAVQQTHERNLATWNPILARQLADPSFAAIAHDQVDNLNSTGQLFQSFKQGLLHPFKTREEGAAMPDTFGSDIKASYQQGEAQYERGMLGIKAKRGIATEADWNRIHLLDQQAPPEPQSMGGRLFGGVAGVAGNIVPMLPRILGVGAAGAGVGAGVGALFGGVGAVPGAFTGFKFGAESEFGAQSYETMAGNAYIDMLNRGVDEHRAQWAAGAVGAVNTALQMGGLRVAGKPLGEAFSRALGDEVSLALEKPTTAAAVKTAIQTWAKGTAIGTGEMGLQTIVSQVGNDYAEGKPITDDLLSEDFGHKLGKSLVDAAVTMGAVNAATGMIGFSSDLGRVQKAEQSAAFFDNLSEQAKASKVRDRNNPTYEQFVQQHADGTGAENVYVDGKQMANLLNQSGLNPEQIEQALPGMGQQVAEAAATGGDVTIPTEQFAARLAGTPLGDAMRGHMRLNPDDMSATEALEFQQKQKELFGQVQEQAKQEVDGNEEFAKSARVVEKNVFDQLKATKTMPDDVARTNASFVRDFVVTQAARQGMTPEAFFEKYRYTIDRASAGVLDQSGEAGKRGGFDPSTLTTLLNSQSDASSFIHETAHYFLSVYGDLAKEEASDPQTKEDFGKLLKWFGVEDSSTWNAMSLEEQRQHHEQFAYSFEKYLSEGKAPSIEAQGMFDRFTQWLKRVYKSVRDDVNTIYRQQHGTDLPILTGEVRDVMDRMLASDEQIKQAQAVRNMEPVFKSQETSGMNEAEWNAYKGMQATATDAASTELAGASVREMQWLSTAKGRLLKAMQAQHTEIRDRVRGEEREALARDQPVYKAEHFLRTGEVIGSDDIAEDHKIDTAAAKDLLPAGADIKDLFGMTKKGGIHPDEAAAVAGFRDGKEMIQALIESPSLKEAADAATDRRMLEEHGDLSTPNGMAAAVEKAVHNEARARLIAFEMRHAFNMDESERVLVKAARETARKMILGQKFSEINPSASAAREARAARQAQAAAARGDVEGVGRAKREQLLQNALTSEGLKARDEADSNLNYLRKFDRPSTAVTKAIGADHMDAINELLAGYGLSARSKYSERSESMANWINGEYGRTGVMPAVADDLVDKLGKMHWKDMTLQQLRDLRDAVKSIDYTGRRQSEVLLGEKAQSITDFVASVSSRLADMEHNPVTDIRADMKYAKGLDKIAVKFLAFKSGIKSADAALLKMEQLFQWIDAGKTAGIGEPSIEGPMQSLYRLASAAEAKERAMRATSSAAMRQLGESIRGSVNLNEALDVPEMPREGRGNRWYRGELIAMALNMGNDGNKTKLLQGYGWDEYGATSAINRLLSKNEMDYVQGVWDHLATYGEGIVELQRRQTGVMPQMVEATPLATRHGTYKGGYYPIVFNDVLDTFQAENQARNADQLFENNYSKPATATGHTVARTGYIGPLYLDLNVIARHIDQVTHDLAWREAIVDMNKVLSDKRLLGELDQVYGREYTKQFRPWLQAMANDSVFSNRGETWWGVKLRQARSNLTMVGLGFRMSTMAIHGTSALSNSLGELGPVWFAKGMRQFVGIDRFQEARDFMYDRSPEMANRMNEADRNVHEAISEIEQHENAITGETAMRKLYDGSRKFAMRGVGMLDMASAGPTWMGAYLKGMAHTADGGEGLGEEAAIAYADRAVRNAHGGGGTKDLAAIQRDKGPLSLFTMFYSYFNHVYNRQRDLAKGWKQIGTGQAAVRDFPKLLARSWFYVVVPALAHTMLAGGKSKDDDGSLAAFMKEAGEGIGLSFVSGLPVVRDLASAAVHGTDYTISPLQKVGQTFVNTAKDAGKVVQGEEPSKRAFQNAAEAFGYATGLPTSQPAATARFLWNVLDGDTDPKSVSDWWHGVLSGRIE